MVSVHLGAVKAHVSSVFVRDVMPRTLATALYPMLFFSGLYYPVQLIGTAIEDISHFTPLGAAVQAIGDSWVAGQFPPAQPLLVLAGYALVSGYLAKRCFRWE